MPYPDNSAIPASGTLYPHPLLQTPLTLRYRDQPGEEALAVDGTPLTGVPGDRIGRLMEMQSVPVFDPTPNTNATILGLRPSVYAPLDAAWRAADRSVEGHVLTPVNGLVPGNASVGPLTHYDFGATYFDGIDDYCLTDYAKRRNLYNNPSFETGITGVFQNAATGTASQSTDAAQIGSYSLKEVCPGTNSYEGVVLTSSAGGVWTTISPSTTYTASAWINAPNGLSLTFRLAFGLSGGGGTTFQDVTVTGNGAWQRVSVTYASSASQGAAAIYVFKNAVSAATFYVDGVLLEQGSSLGTYFDGSGYINDSGTWIPSPDGYGNKKTGWLGTAHASASDKGVFANGTVRTFCGWAYQASDAQPCVLFSQTPNSTTGPIFRVEPTPNSTIFGLWINANVGISNYFTGAWPGPGRWGHWSLVLDQPGNKINLRVNGAQAGTADQAFNTAWSGDPVSLVLASWGGGQVWSGSQAHFAVFERGLTVAEQTAVYNAR